MKTFKQFILETTLALIKNKKIKIDLKSIKLDDTKHSKERLNRMDNQGAEITENEIIKNIENAIPDILSDIANVEIKQDAKIWIYNSKTGLNIIVKLDFHQGQDSLIVVTTMRKKSFKSNERKYIVG